MRKFVLNSVFLIAALAFWSCSNEEAPPEGPEVLILEDLSVLFDKGDVNMASRGDCGFGLEDVKGFPVNGCGTFTVKQTINYVFGETTVETKVTVCCSCAVCFPMRLSSKDNISGVQKGKVTSIRVDDSSSISFRNYEISIARGDYAVDAYGNIKKLKYQVIVH